MDPGPGLVADLLYSRATQPADAGSDPAADTLGALVRARISGDPALAQLEREAAAGIENERTRRRVNDAVHQAMDDDAEFAQQVRDVLRDLDPRARRVAEPPAGFDPFSLIPVFPLKMRNRSSAWLLLPGMVMTLLLVVATAIEGTLGSADDFQVVQDVRAVFGGSVRTTEPSFPLIRDVTSIFLLLVIITGVVLLHKQWQYIARALPTLRRNNVVVARRRPRSNLASRLIGLDRVLRGSGEYEALDRLDQRLGRIRTKTKVLLAAFVLLFSFVMARLAENGLSRTSFEVLAPTGVSAQERTEWVTQARDSWWAGPDHPVGLVLFALLTWFAMALVLSCNAVGLVTVYLAVSLYFVADLRVDWFNRDGRFGLMPVVHVSRTVYFCLILLGAGISFVVAVLSSQILFSLVGLVALYVLFIPIFTVVPWAVFRTIEKQARAKRLEELSEISTQIAKTDLERAKALVDEYTRIRRARINPMRLGAAPSSVFASFVLLPIILTSLQIYAQVGLGRGGS